MPSVEGSSPRSVFGLFALLRRNKWSTDYTRAWEHLQRHLYYGHRSSSRGVLLVGQVQTSFELQLLWTSYSQTSCSKMSWADLCCVLQSSLTVAFPAPDWEAACWRALPACWFTSCPGCSNLLWGTLRISCTMEKAAYLSSHTNILWSLFIQHNIFYKILGKQILS